MTDVSPADSQRSSEPGDCPQSPRAHAWCDGELDPQAARAFEAHWGECPVCQREVEQVRQLARLFDDARSRNISSDSMARLHEAIDQFGELDEQRRAAAILPMARVLLALAASVLIVAGVWTYDTPRANHTGSAVVVQRWNAAPQWERWAGGIDPWNQFPGSVTTTDPDHDRVRQWMIKSLAEAK